MSQARHVMLKAILSSTILFLPSGCAGALSGASVAPESGVTEIDSPPTETSSPGESSVLEGEDPIPQGLQLQPGDQGSWTCSIVEFYPSVTGQNFICGFRLDDHRKGADGFVAPVTSDAEWSATCRDWAKWQASGSGHGNWFAGWPQGLGESEAFASLQECTASRKWWHADDSGLIGHWTCDLDDDWDLSGISEPGQSGPAPIMDIFFRLTCGFRPLGVIGAPMIWDMTSSTQWESACLDYGEWLAGKESAGSWFDEFPELYREYVLFSSVDDCVNDGGGAHFP